MSSLSQSQPSRVFRSAFSMPHSLPARSPGWRFVSAFLLAAICCLVGQLFSLPVAAQQSPTPQPGMQADNLPPRSINMEDVAYPYPVSYLPLRLYDQDVRLAYMDVQPTKQNNGKTVVLMHGMNWFGEYYGDTIRRLTNEGFRVVVPDQIGFGRSSKPIIPYRLDDHVANSKALLDSLGISKAAIVGHSMGGMIATRFVFSHPDIATHFVIINQIGLTDSRLSRGWSRIDASYQRELGRDYAAVRRNIERYFVTWDPAYERYVDMMYGWTLSSEWPRAAMVRALNFQWIYAEPVVYDRPHIKARTLFISGADDGRNFRENAQAVVDAIPNAELILFDGVGHIPFMEDPKRFFPPFIEFLKKG